ncbi:MAG: alpha/beta fold hydrolase [Acidobacteriota bacterium]
MSESVFDSAGVAIRYVDHAAAEAPERLPALLLHGFTLDLDTNWSALMPALAAERRTIAFDLRGHGRSGTPHEPAAYGEPMALDAVRLLDHLGVAQVHLVGYSMGAEIALKLLELAPERFRSAVLGGAGWMRPNDFKHQTWAGGIPVLEAVEPGTSILDAFAPPPEMAPSDELRAIIDANDPRALAGVSRGMLTMTVAEDALRRIAVPTTVIFGEHDWIRPTLDGMSEVMPDLTVHIVPGLDHEQTMFDDAYIELVRTSLSRHDGSPAGG